MIAQHVSPATFQILLHHSPLPFLNTSKKIPPIQSIFHFRKKFSTAKKQAQQISPMASEAATEQLSVSSLIARLMAMPFLSLPESDSDSDSTHHSRIILINPMTQGMVVIGGNAATNFETLMNDLMKKEGQPPASQMSIDEMPSVEIKGGDEMEKLGLGLGSECVICLEEYRVGDVVKEMPCKHKFHGGCVEKWLKVHGSCPVCRHEMPVDEDSNSEKKIGDESGRRRREVWISFSFGDGRSTSEESVESN